MARESPQVDQKPHTSPNKRPVGTQFPITIVSSLLLASALLLASRLIDMRAFSPAVWTGISSLVGSVYAERCVTKTISTTPPTDGSEVALQSYSYCGGTLDVTAYVDNVAYNKIVTLYYTNRQNESTPLSSLNLGYQAAVSDSNWEFWNADVPVWLDGIAQFLNVTFEDVDNGQTYDQVLNIPISPSGAPEPTLPSPPAPYATPKGFSDDITDYLAISSGSEAEIARQGLFRNINPAINGAVKGTVVAARSGPSYPDKDPDYEYNWVRDASLTMDVVEGLYAAATDKTAKAQYEEILFEYARARATEQNDPDLLTGLGEPKFYLNNTIFSGPWGRPQNDGPATSALTLMNFALNYLSDGGSIETVKEKIYDSSAHPATAPVQKDLLFVAANWSCPSYDLWEEVEGDQFYTRMVQRAALVRGNYFAMKMGDFETGATLRAAAGEITALMNQFWDPNRQILLYEYGPVLDNKTSFLDTAVILGVLHGYVGEIYMPYTDDRVLSTAVRLVTSFIDVYPIANKTHTDFAGNPLAPPIGRYPEDVYDGTGNKPEGGNPWYLCTAALAQYMYSASREYSGGRPISVTEFSKPFFDYFAPETDVQVGKTYKSGSKQSENIVDSLIGWGDAFMRTVKYYTPENGRLHEEFNRNNGEPQGAADLTWSYASLLTAALERAFAKGEGVSYARELANLGVRSNT